MVLIYSQSQLVLVINAQNLLSRAGIKSQLKNEYLAGAAGDLSPFDTWPELWVEQADIDQARVIIDAMTCQANSEWLCTQCGESNGGAFEQCWQCATEPQHD